MDSIPTDRIIDGVDQTSLFINGDTLPVDPEKLPFDPTEVSKRPLPFTESDL